MRTDVKIGVLVSFGIALIGGILYFSRDGAEKKPIPLDTQSAKDPAQADHPTPSQPIGRGANGRPDPSTTASTPATGPNRGALRPPASGTAGSAQRSSADRPDNRTAGGPVTPPERPGSAASPSPTPGPGTREGTAAPASALAAAGSEGDRSAPTTGTPAAGGRRPLPTPLPVTQPTGSAASPAMDRHRVVSGDTMSSLAVMYYGSDEFSGFLADANKHVANITRLEAGTILNIPPKPDQPALASSPPREDRPGANPPKSDSAPKKNSRTYVVVEGDTFYGIAGKMLGNSNRWQELLALNKTLVDGDPKRLRPGQVLSLPE